MRNLLHFTIGAIIVYLLLLSCSQNTVKQKSIDSSGLEKNESINTLSSKDNGAILIIEKIKNSGDGFGQITFTQNDNLLFYFTQKEQEGRIIINGISHSITYCTNDNNTYKLQGAGLTIIAKDLIEKGSGGDCFHYNCPILSITLNELTTNLKDVVIQDCLSFSWE
jgi:hypothetical protein